MYVSCPVCETRIDYETVGANDKSIYCPSCKSDVSIEGLITSRLVSKFDDSPTRTMTIDLSNDIAIKPGGFIGKFEILEIVGEGGFGSVYKARDHELDRIVEIFRIDVSAPRVKQTEAPASAPVANGIKGLQQKVTTAAKSYLSRGNAAVDTDAEWNEF